MRYFLKKSYPSKRGLYLQIYRTNYVPGKGNMNKSYKALGYASDLIDSGIADPIKYAKSLVDELNEKTDSKIVKQIGDVSTCKYLGHFLLKAMLDALDIDGHLNIFTSQKKFTFKMSDFVRAMIYAQVIHPSSKLKAFENVLPSIYGIEQFSYSQILDATEYIGEDYEKYIELFNHKIAKLWERRTEVNFFDCTNYYFEIDLEDDVRKKGVSKENRHSPIISQALLLDAEQIPIGMKMYPGNQSEKPELRKMIEDTKSRFDIHGRVIQVADKGLNCPKNIYAAVKEANDGYIFSKSIHGNNLSQVEKEWLLLDNEYNIWHTVHDERGKVLYKYKEIIDTFDYSFVDDNKQKVSFKVKEKRIVTYTPALAKKQRVEIEKEIDKAKYETIKSHYRKELGDKVKYIDFEACTNEGEEAKITAKLNQDKIEEDLRLAGYNMLITSEINMKAEEIYKVYHHLWRIEESFKVMKSYLEARPVFLHKEESIYGHFTIVYLALVVLRLLELKVFKDKVPIPQLIEFIRSYKITDTGEGKYINNAIKSKIFLTIKETLGLSKLGNLLLSQRDVDLLLKTEI